jgi:hypothetical protein
VIINYNGEKLSSDYNFSVNKFWVRWAGHLARMGEMRNANKILVGKPEGKRPIERPKP